MMQKFISSRHSLVDIRIDRSEKSTSKITCLRLLAIITMPFEVIFYWAWIKVVFVIHSITPPTFAPFGITDPYFSLVTGILDPLQMIFGAKSIYSPFAIPLIFIFILLVKKSMHNIKGTRSVFLKYSVNF